MVNRKRQTQKSTGKKESVAVVVADIEHEAHAEVDVDMRQSVKRANWP